MLNNRKNDYLFIRIYNEMINEKSEKLLTNEALYVYALSFTNARMDGSVYISVDMIDSIMQSAEGLQLFSRRVQTNKAKIKESLVELVEKEVLIVHEDIDINDIKNNTFITLRVHDDLKGYEELYFGELRMFIQHEELKIYAITKKFTEYSGNFKASYDRWAKLLCVSRNTAQKLLNDAEKRGLVTIERGKHIAKNQQEINLYRHVDFMDDEREDNQPQEQSITEEQQVEESAKSINQSNQQEPTVAFGSKEDKVVAFDSVKKDKPTMSIKDKVGDSLPF